MTVEAYHPGHLVRLRMPPEVQGLAEKFDLAPKLKILAGMQCAFTILAPGGDPVLGVVAAVPFSDGTCEVFVAGSVHQRKYKKVFAAAVREVLEQAKERFTLVRALGDDTPELSRWFTWLGFKRVGFVSRPQSGDGVLWSMGGRA